MKINDIKIFYKFEIIDTNDITTNDNNINTFNIIGFGYV